MDDYTGKTLYIMSGTHWDREWYQPLQGFRYRLVNMIDHLIEYLEQTPEFPVFTFDGQTVVLEDYLEIRPENRPRLEALIQAGRILVGPWYCMPDELILSGESLIANLAEGHRVARSFGVEPWKFGYVCDIFGHAAQTPQIFQGFGLEYAILGRGTQKAETPYFFRWRALDGSECLVHRLEGGRSYGTVVNAVLPRWNKAESDEEKDRVLKEEVDHQFELSGLPAAYLADAADHQPLHPFLLEYKARIERICPGLKVVIADLREMGRAVEPFREELKVRTGELNRPQRTPGDDCETITNTVSSRYDIKQQNDRCQTLVEKWMNPLTLLSALQGRPLPDTYRRLATRYLLQNHPHDSICGCSVTQVHRDMHYRFDQCRLIANELIGDVLFHHRQSLPTGDGWQFLVNLYDPLPYPREETLTLPLILPADFPNRYQERFGYDDVAASFELFDTDGRRVPYTLHRVQRDYCERAFGPHEDAGWLHEVTVRVRLCGGGVTQLILKPSGRPTRQLGSLLTGPTSAENEYLSLCVNPDGTLCITDKATGKVYTRVGSYLDDAEIGDGWYHCGTIDDRVVTSVGSPCTVSVEADGPTQAVFRIRHEIRVPARVERTTYRMHHLHRSEQTVILPVTTTVTLNKGEDAVRVSTAVHNTARDHRLRLLAETGIPGDRYFASEAFCFVDRACGVDPLSYNWTECDPPEKAMGGIVGKRDNDGDGFAVVCAGGLHEGGALADGRVTVTLLRCFSATRGTVGEEDGQLPGDWRFDYAFVPLRQGDHLSRLQRLQDRLSAGVRVSLRRVSNEETPGDRSFIRLEQDEGRLCLSTCKLPDDGAADTAVVRLYNPSYTAAAGVLRLDRPIREAAVCDLLEQPRETLPTNGACLSLTLPPWKIVTLRLRLDPPTV